MRDDIRQLRLLPTAASLIVDCHEGASADFLRDSDNQLSEIQLTNAVLTGLIQAELTLCMRRLRHAADSV